MTQILSRGFISEGSDTSFLEPVAPRPAVVAASLIAMAPPAVSLTPGSAVLDPGLVALAFAANCT